MTYAVVVEGLETLKNFGQLKGRVRLAAVQAVNKGARDGRSLGARRIASQIEFPAGYLDPSKGRLVVAQKANRARPEAVIRARSRPTSLARFVTSRQRRGVTVSVKSGRARFLRRAFLVRLRQGSGLTETQFNMGLAIRLRPGEKLSNKIKQVQLGKGLVLLYGPSVQQVFLDNAGEGVAKDISPEILDKMEREFFRLLDR